MQSLIRVKKGSMYLRLKNFFLKMLEGGVGSFWDGHGLGSILELLPYKKDKGARKKGGTKKKKVRGETKSAILRQDYKAKVGKNEREGENSRERTERKTLKKPHFNENQGRKKLQKRKGKSPRKRAKLGYPQQKTKSIPSGDHESPKKKGGKKKVEGLKNTGKRKKRKPKRGATCNPRGGHQDPKKGKYPKGTNEGVELSEQTRSHKRNGVGTKKTQGLVLGSLTSRQPRGDRK